MVRPSIGRAARSPVLLIVGAATRDVVAADPRGWRLGGGVSYGAMATARLGLSVRALIGVDPEAAAAPELAWLRRAGVDLRLVELRRGPVMENRATPDGRLQLVQQASDPLPIEALPPAWRTPDGALLAPVAGELDDAWATVFEPSMSLALAWQGLLRRLIPGQPMAALPLRPRQLIERADIALVSPDDVGPDAAALADLLTRTGQQLVISRGERGAVHVSRAAAGLRWRHVPTIPAGEVRDSTGAGDVFLAAWFAAMLAGRRAGSPLGWRALAVAAAAASLSVRSTGLTGLAGPAEVCRVLRERQTPATPAAGSGPVEPAG